MGASTIEQMDASTIEQMGAYVLEQMDASMFEQLDAYVLDQVAFLSCLIYSPNGAEASVTPVKRRKERRPG